MWWPVSFFCLFFCNFIYLFLGYLHFFYSWEWRVKFRFANRQITSHSVHETSYQQSNITGHCKTVGWGWWGKRNLLCEDVVEDKQVFKSDRWKPGCNTRNRKIGCFEKKISQHHPILKNLSSFFEIDGSRDAFPCCNSLGREGGSD